MFIYPSGDFKELNPGPFSARECRIYILFYLALYGLLMLLMWRIPYEERKVVFSVRI